MADTHINAYQAEAVAAIGRAQAAQDEADTAVAAFVDQGGNEADLRPVPEEVADPNAKKAKATAKKADTRQRDAKGHYIKESE